MRFRDIETDEFLTMDQLAEEYHGLKEHGDTEAETLDDYITNCLEETLVIVRD